MTDPDTLDDERASELFTIQAIYPELVIDSQNPSAASLDIPVAPAKAFPVIFPPLGGGAPAHPPTPPSSDGAESATTKPATGPGIPEIRYLSYLPPLNLHIILPDGYPELASPQVELTANPSWIPESKLKDLENTALELWKRGGQNQMVFDYIDSLQQAAEEGLNLVSKGGSALELGQELEIALLDFDLKAKRAKFEQETFECGVCLG